MEAPIIISSFALLFLAEMGDKTQLMAMTLAHRYPVKPVISGALLAFLILNLLAVIVGEALYQLVPQRAVLFFAGALFLFFSYRFWREASEAAGNESAEPRSGHGAFVSTFLLIFVAELGDKTQLVLIALVGTTGELWSVFVGGTLALWAVTLIAILLGATVLRRIPKVWMHRVAAGLFLVFGILAVGQAIWRSGDSQAVAGASIGITALR